MAQHAQRPGIGRVQIWVDCSCGAEVTFADVDPEGSTTQQCGGCRRTIEIIASIDTQDISPTFR